MNLDQIKFFERPLTSGPRDRVVGQSELGPVYETVTGDTYIVSPKEDQRTENEKIRSALGAAKDWVQNPELPEGDDILGFLESTAEGVWDMASIPGDLASGERSGIDVQMGDAMGMAPAMGAASAPFKVPEGSTRIFGGRRAKTKNDGISEEMNPYWEAIEMKEAGVDDAIIWEETGWQFDPENRTWQFEIDSNQIEIKESGFNKLAKDIEDYNKKKLEDPESVAEQYSPYKEAHDLKDFVDFPELFENYPQLEGAAITFKGGRGGSFQVIEDFDIDEETGELKKVEVPLVTIGIDHMEDADEFLDVLVHELQHGVQAIEGTSGGANQQYFQQIPPTPEMEQRKIYLDNLEQEINHLETKWFELADIENKTDTQVDQMDRLQNEMTDILNELIPAKEQYNKDAFLYYRGNPGEIEARAAEGRRYLTAGEKAETPPSETKREMLNRELDRYRGAIMPTATLSSYSDQARYSKGGLVQRRTK